MDIPYEEITFDCAGVNHTSWFTTFRRGDQDLLHEVYETMSRRHAERGEERVRTELMRLSGYFHTESSHHASEYWAWFRKTPGLTKQYLENRWDYYEICSAHETEDRNQQLIDEAATQGLHASYEYGSWVIDSIVTNTPRVIYGNVPNNGAITNLPSDACVEVACLVDAHGVRPVRYGSLPLACASLNNVQINVQRLAVDAALARDRSLVYAAVALDPLTSALLTLPEIREMVDRMLEAQAEWLPGFSRLSTDGARAVTSDAVRGRSDG
jgi:alpha-galactosidase